MRWLLLTADVAGRSSLEVMMTRGSWGVVCARRRVRDAYEVTNVCPRRSDPNSQGMQRPRPRPPAAVRTLVMRHTSSRCLAARAAF